MKCKVTLDCNVSVVGWDVKFGAMVGNALLGVLFNTRPNPNPYDAAVVSRRNDVDVDDDIDMGGPDAGATDDDMKDVVEES